MPRPHGRDVGPAMTGFCATGARAGANVNRRLAKNIRRPALRWGGISQRRRRRNASPHSKASSNEIPRAAAARAASIKPIMADTSGEAPIEWNQRPRRECCHTDTPRQAGLSLRNRHAASSGRVDACQFVRRQIDCAAAKIAEFLQEPPRLANCGRHRNASPGARSFLPAACSFCKLT